MKPRTEKQKLAEARSHANKPRFKIEKLEERIAPKVACRAGDHCKGGGGRHYNPHGKWVGG